jgi:hypothetical protein
MKSSLRDTEKNEAVKEAARILGRMGGLAGTGKSKARPSDVCRAAVNKRWDAYRKEQRNKAKS